MSWTDKLFQYCERGSNPDFWAEPLNAVTNLAFIIGAVVAFGMARKQPPGAMGMRHYTLIALVFIIGVGSGLFHTFATRWSMLADVLPIAVFMFAFLAFSLNRFLGYGLIGVVIGMMLFVLAISSLEFVKCDGGPCLNGTIGYAPALAALIIMGVAALLKKHPAGFSLITAGIVFTISAAFRTIDFDACSLTKVTEHPLGTHFMWHLLNALTLFILLRAAVLYGHKNQKIATAPG